MKTKLSNKKQMWIAGGAALLLTLLAALIINWVWLGTLSSRIKDTSAANNAMRAQIEENYKTIESLSSDEYIDHKAHTELGLVKKGEQLWAAE